MSKKLGYATDDLAVNNRRRRRRYGWTLLGLAACAVAPLVRFLASTYFRDIKMLDARWPASPTFSRSDRILILSPHCDDETLGAGGLIATSRNAGAHVKVVFFTNGDGSGSTQIAENIRRRRRTQFQELAAMRQREATAAVVRLGVPQEDIIFLGYPDGGLKSLWEENWTADNLYRSPYTRAERSPYDNSYTPNAPYCGSQVVDDVAAILEEFRPTAIYTTHPADTHPDHWAAYAYTAAALERVRLQAGNAWARASQLITFLVHHGIWPVPHGYRPEDRLAPPASLRDSGTLWMETGLTIDERDTKKAALEEYVSQMVFTPNYLRAFVRSNELFGRIPVDTVLPATGSAPVDTQRESSAMPDEARDTFWNSLWQAGDVRTVQLLSTGGTEGSDLKGWQLRIVLGTEPSARLSYALTLHPIEGAATEGDTEATTMQAYRIEISLGEETTAKLFDIARGSQVALRAKRNGNDLEVTVPHALVAGGENVEVFMVSASVRFGKTLLDQTPIGIFRLRPP